jgi:hypothetical protein
MIYETRDEPLDDPSAWRGAALARRGDWIVRLDESDLGEVDAALSVAVASGRPLFEMDRADFPLAALAETLTGILPVLEGGRGFALLRGLPVDRYTEDETRIVFWGIGQYLGVPERQDRAGNLMHDVRDTGKAFAGSNTLRDYQTDAAINFHNDGADIFMLMCRRAAPRGGHSLLVSAVEVFNEVARRRPDLAELLQQPCWYMDTRGQRPDGARYQVMPIYTYWNGQLTPNYKNSLMYAAQRFDDVPRFTGAQKEAIALLDEICGDPDICLRFDLRPGDIAIASNYATFHGRTDYADAGESDAKRHMLRMWLTIPNGRALPPNFEGTREYGATYDRRRNGEPSE